MTDFLFITPPFTQLNTPYPATAYLKGFFNTKNISSFQMDLGIEVILRLFTSEVFEQLFDYAYENDLLISENSQRIYVLRNEYLKTIDEVIRFLQGDNPTLARQICTQNFLPQASRFDQIEELEYAFGMMGLQDKAKHLATLYLEDLSDFLIECVDDHFGFSRYAERLGRCANSFDELYDELSADLTFIDQITIEVLEEAIQNHNPKIICISIPFPGNLYSGLRCGQYVKSKYPDITISVGGGFPNTELRSVSDPRVFEFMDYITLDDGELPLELLHKNVTENPEVKFYKRTFMLENGAVVYKNDALRNDYKMHQVGTPDYSDLPLDQYISVIEVANPMHSLWSDGRWNKLTMAHGCYWGKCTFCDVSLDYIKNYDPVHASLLVDRMEEMIEKTGETGFHFVDEAAPPALMRELALEILKRGLVVTWWANIRFEKRFTLDLCKLLKASGCIAVSGGLEVASDRLLKLIDKGVTVEQVARVTRNFTESEIMVHSYLMYGYPTQTIQETVDSLEMVRQLFEVGVLQSAFWHQFALTAHSPIGLNPSDYGIYPKYNEITFANNDIEFEDSTGIDHSIFSHGLKKSLFNYMHGMCFEMELQEWFDFEIPSPTIPLDFIQNCLDSESELIPKSNSKVIWLGNLPYIQKNNAKNYIFHFHNNQNLFHLETDSDLGEWMIEMLGDISCFGGKYLKYSDLRISYESMFDNFEEFWWSDQIMDLKSFGLLVI